MIYMGYVMTTVRIGCTILAGFSIATALIMIHRGVKTRDELDKFRDHMLISAIAVFCIVVLEIQPWADAQ